MVIGVAEIRLPDVALRLLRAMGLVPVNRTLAPLSVRLETLRTPLIVPVPPDKTRVPMPLTALPLLSLYTPPAMPRVWFAGTLKTPLLDPRLLIVSRLCAVASNCTPPADMAELLVNRPLIVAVAATPAEPTCKTPRLVKPLLVIMPLVPVRLMVPPEVFHSVGALSVADAMLMLPLFVMSPETTVLVFTLRTLLLMILPTTEALTVLGVP